MKTYRTEFHSGFSNVGINPESVAARNSGLLADCMNVRLTKNGLEGYATDFTDVGAMSFVDSVTGSAVTITKRWPFPQLFLTDAGLFLGALEGLFWLSDDSPKTLFTFGAGAITWPWSCAPIGKYPAFTSGDVLIYYDNIAEAYKKVTYA